MVSMFKGWLFVAVTSLFLYLLLRRRSVHVPKGDARLHGGLLTWRRNRIYMLSVVATLLTLLVNHGVLSKFADHPILLALMLPIILSASLGGVGPGLLSTLIGALGTAVYAEYVAGDFQLRQEALIPWGLFILNGVLVSFMAELMRRSWAHSAFASGERLQALKLLGCIAESSDDAIFAKDLEGRYQLFNQAASRLVGKPVEAVLGQDAYALFSRTQADEITAIEGQVMRENRAITREEHLSTPAGERSLRVTIGPLHDSLGRVIGVFGIARDLNATASVRD
jgi:PAS domain S-box-containing protein